jgi:hypothetical protein
VKLTLSIDKHGPQHQASLNVKYDDDTGHGYRLLGPKYIGDSRLVKEAELSERDAQEIRKLLDEVYPPAKTQATNDLEAWEALGETISHRIPEHYEASEGALVGIIEAWANDAETVVAKAHNWRKRGRSQEDGDALDAAVEKIYPSEDYL